mmetsp:Transcript_35742/g.115361  ORF Transcript_35742/g.115361 Transcript_35742/m.115361 type:complete len:245 (+) Transcript_35742:31-765(+)
MARAATNAQLLNQLHLRFSAKSHTNYPTPRPQRSRVQPAPPVLASPRPATPLAGGGGPGTGSRPRKAAGGVGGAGRRAEAGAPVAGLLGACLRATALARGRQPKVERHIRLRTARCSVASASSASEMPWKMRPRSKSSADTSSSSQLPPGSRAAPHPFAEPRPKALPSLLTPPPPPFPLTGRPPPSRTDAPASASASRATSSFHLRDLWHLAARSLSSSTTSHWDGSRTARHSSRSGTPPQIGG